MFFPQSWSLPHIHNNNTRSPDVHYFQHILSIPFYFLFTLCTRWFTLVPLSLLLSLLGLLRPFLPFQLLLRLLVLLLLVLLLVLQPLRLSLGVT